MTNKLREIPKKEEKNKPVHKNLKQEKKAIVESNSIGKKSILDRIKKPENKNNKNKATQKIIEKSHLEISKKIKKNEENKKEEIQQEDIEQNDR